MEKKIVLVTGASSGIGQETAKLMARQGYIVYGTSRLANFEKTSYTMIPMTLEDEGSVGAAVKHVAQAHGRIDVLVNAAGSGIAGAVEETSAEEAKAQFDVCLFGALSVQSAVLPYMRAQGSGMIINIGSMASCFPVPFQGMYSAVKAALFMMSATLAMELKPFGIKVCVVEPGDTKTGFTDKREYTKRTAKTAYNPYFERALYEMIRSELNAYGPQKCAKMVLKTAEQKNPPIRKSVGIGYKTLYAASKLLPWRAKMAVIKMIYLIKDPPSGAVWTFDKQFGKAANQQKD
ncbi:MAG: SDR family oxidoreductase [Clostridia bacterium]|jgi:short-subunit dehydrogenase|nr:SDR family oxidoreductase [Clostridia bacterium]